VPTNKGITTVGVGDSMKGPEQITKVATDVDTLLDNSAATSTALSALIAAAKWLGRQLTVADKKVRYEWDGGGWVAAGWPGLQRHWKAQYFANAVGGGQTMASRTVPVRPHAQRVHVIGTGTGGYGSSNGYVTIGLSWTGAGVTVTSNGKTYADPAKTVDTGLENGSAFNAAQFVSLSRAFDVEIPAGVECTLTFVNDASVVAYYRLSFEGRTYGEGEFV
jgi:hypothetical protein